MHNGIYDNLIEVMAFYNKGGGVGLNLDVPNQTLPSGSLNLNQGEVNDIIAFIKTLDDQQQSENYKNNLSKNKSLQSKKL
jgi:cytochrome c peroxidase